MRCVFAKTKVQSSLSGRLPPSFLWPWPLSGQHQPSPVCMSFRFHLFQKVFPKMIMAVFQVPGSWQPHQLQFQGTGAIIPGHWIYLHGSLKLVSSTNWGISNHWPQEMFPGQAAGILMSRSLLMRVDWEHRWCNCMEKYLIISWEGIKRISHILIGKVPRNIFRALSLWILLVMMGSLWKVYFWATYPWIQ